MLAHATTLLVRSPVSTREANGGGSQARAAYLPALLLALTAYWATQATPVAAHGTHVVPAPLLGRWVRTVTAADIKRTGSTTFQPGTVCKLTIARPHEITIDCAKGIGVFQGSIESAGVRRVHFDLGTEGANVYRWRVKGRTLSFVKVVETVPDRETGIEGVWRKLP